MDDFLNRLLDRASQFFGERPGFLPLLGLLLITLNLLAQFVVGTNSWWVESNILLHAGLITALIGLLLVRPLG